MPDRPDNSRNPAISSVVIPHFGGVALSVLPFFLEVIGDPESPRSSTFRNLRRMEFDPGRDDKWPDPPEGKATFCFYYDEHIRVVITISYRPGEEGTRGSVDKIRTIELFLGNRRKIFHYLKHHCLCRHCKGIKYPFVPENVEWEEFENMSEEERLAAIRKYLEKT